MINKHESYVIITYFLELGEVGHNAFVCSYLQALAPPLFIVLKVLLSSGSSHYSSSANSK
jgi:hypothetical protein